jgi:hypothetical protein
MGFESYPVGLVSAMIGGPEAEWVDRRVLVTSGILRKVGWTGGEGDTGGQKAEMWLGPDKNLLSLL